MFLKPRIRLLGNPLPRLGTRPKIVNMLSDAIGPLGIHMPATSVHEGLWFERWSGVFLGHADFSIKYFPVPKPQLVKIAHKSKNMVSPRPLDHLRPSRSQKQANAPLISARLKHHFVGLTTRASYH